MAELEIENIDVLFHTRFTDGATHIETYWVPRIVDQATSKLDTFFDKNI